MNEVLYKELESIVPERMTEGAYRFFSDAFWILQFHQNIEHTAKVLDEFGRTTGRLFLSEEDLVPIERDLWTRLESDGFKAVAKGRKFDSFQMQMLFSRFVDSFLTYVSEILVTIFRAKPEALRSGEQVKLEDILKHHNMEDLVNFLVERKVHRLSYQGLGELNLALKNELGFPLFVDVGELASAKALVEQRNLLAHSRGVVNQIFLQRVPNSQYKIGEKIEIDTQSLAQTLQFLALVVVQVDGRAVTKFGIEPTHSKPEPVPATNSPSLG